MQRPSGVGRRIRLLLPVLAAVMLVATAVAWAAAPLDLLRHDGPGRYWWVGLEPGQLSFATYTHRTVVGDRFAPSATAGWPWLYLQRRDAIPVAGVPADNRLLNGGVALVALALVAWSLLTVGLAWNWACRARRTPVGLCPVCGYDLRATPGRCPECGTASAIPSAAALD